MFSKRFGLGGYTPFLTGFKVLLSFFIISTAAIADWNSGVTIEDITTRIAINIVDDGVQVSVDLKKMAVAQFHSVPATSTDSNNLNQFALNVIKINAEQLLTPAIKQPVGPDIKNSAAVISVFFPFTKPLPQQLEIIPDFQTIKKAGEKYIVTVSHQGLPVIDHGVLTSTEPLKLNWQDPWYSHFLNPKLQRGHIDPVMAFLYIEPNQVKSEVVVRIKEMATWANLKLRDDTMVYPDEFAMIKQKVSQFLLTKNKLTTGSNTSTPVLDRVDYIRMGASDIQAYEPQQAQKQVATLIGVSIIHPISAIPEKIQWQWGLFNEKIQRVAIRAYDPAGLFDSYVTQKHPIFEWENMLADIDLPELDNKPQSVAVAVDEEQAATQYYFLMGIISFFVLFTISYKLTPVPIRKYTHTSILLLTLFTTYDLLKNSTASFGIGKMEISDLQATPILNQLLWNIYQAFEATQEDATYDQLAYSVSGDLRESLYLQNRQAFLVQDGAWSKISGIKIQTIKNLSSTLDNSYLFDCEWLVTGEVIHWGHQHRRENLYHANIKIAPIDGNWKIIELESIGQQRVDE